MGRPRSAAVATRDGEIYGRWNAGERSLTALAKDYGITPQRVGQVIAAKDREVYAAWRTGRYTLADLADLYDLTSEDAIRIVTERHPAPKDEETGRAVMRSRIEVLTVAIQQVIENPGYKITAVGRVAEDPDGNPLVDVSAKIEAMKVQLNAFKQLAVLNGDEKPQRTNVTHEVAEQQKNTALALIAARIAERDRELEALRRQVAVVPGEVLAELPPGGA